MKNIIAIGAATVDTKLKAYSDLKLETKNPVCTMKSHGGVGRNVVENLARLGAKVQFGTFVGEDQAGQSILTELNQLGVDVSNCIQLKNYGTAHYYASLQPNGDLFVALSDMRILDDAPWPMLLENWKAWPSAAYMFIDANLPQKMFELAINHAIQHHNFICIDPVSLAKASKIKQYCYNLHLLKANQQEIGMLADHTINSIEDIFIASERLFNQNNAYIITTCASQGYVIYSKHVKEFISIEAISNCIDVTGAGDAFCSGTIFGLAQGYPIKKACEIGHEIALLCLQSERTVSEKIESRLS